jgi:hypothetical protein
MSIHESITLLSEVVTVHKLLVRFVWIVRCFRNNDHFICGIVTHIFFVTYCALCSRFLSVCLLDVSSPAVNLINVLANCVRCRKPNHPCTTIWLIRRDVQWEPNCSMRTHEHTYHVTSWNGVSHAGWYNVTCLPTLATSIMSLWRRVYFRSSVMSLIRYSRPVFRTALMECGAILCCLSP